jgi:hypothetical protein
MNTERTSFEVRRDGRFVEFASRAVRRHKGWLSVRYDGKRYQLMGGIRTPYWINLDRER